MLSGLVIYGVLCFTVLATGPVAQGLEQGTHNSRKSFCVRFRPLVQCCGRSVFQPFRLAPRYAELLRFASKNLHAVENDREKIQRRINLRFDSAFSWPIDCIG
jgi:hypothetical protein